MFTVSHLLCGEEEGALLPDSLGVLDFLLCSLILCLSGTVPGLFLGLCLPQAAHRLFFGAEKSVMGGRGPLRDAAWELELDGSQGIVQAILHPLQMHSPAFVSLG